MLIFFSNMRKIKQILLSTFFKNIMRKNINAIFHQLYFYKVFE